MDRETEENLKLVLQNTQEETDLAIAHMKEFDAKNQEDFDSELISYLKATRARRQAKLGAITVDEGIAVKVI